jgi:glycerol-3-phosphate acyltransferase PlsY
MTIMRVLACFFAGYLVGSIPFGILIGRLAAGVDIRRFGTGNIGASNTFRNLGMLPASVVGVLSFAQGFCPAWTAGHLTGSAAAVAAAGTGSVAGYAWSGFLRLKGGSAVGTATGALAAFAPLVLIPVLAFYAVGGLLRHPAPLVLLGLLAGLAFLIATPHDPELVLGASVIVLVIVVKRMAGVRMDLRTDPDHRMAVILDRLVHDRRPGQRLSGPIERRPAP